VSIAQELGVDAKIVLYLKTPPSRDELEWIIGHLEDPVTNLVRRDAVFDKLGLTDADVVTAAQVADVLSAHPKLMQRPVVRKGNVALIGRPKDRVRTLLGG
jgi:arsenate reductase